MTAFLMGCASGFFATVPMTLVMLYFHWALPSERHEPLPPKKITKRSVEIVHLDRYIQRKQWDWLTLAGHFIYGTFTGGLLGLLIPRIPVMPLIQGMIFGLIVWAGSYLGWVPALHLMRSAAHQRPERNFFMIVAHLFWGAAAGYLFHRFSLHIDL